MAGDLRNPKAKRNNFTIGLIGLVILIVLYSSWELHEASVTHAERDGLETRFLGGITGTSRSKGAELGNTTSNLSSQERSEGTDNEGPSEADSGKHESANTSPKPSFKKNVAKTLLKTDAYHINSCFAYPYLDFSGVAVKYGYTNKKDNAGQCCDDCLNFKADGNDPDALDCNVWVWCGDKEMCKEHYQECWLKHIAHLQVANPLGAGHHIGWTVGTKDTMDLRDAFAGLVARNQSASYEDAQASAKAFLDAKFEREPTVKPFHTITSFQGRGVEWSMRIHYYHFRKMRAQCRAELGDRCEMGGFTRLLHSGASDQLCDEMPTIVVDPLPETVVPHRQYVVLNRPYAFVEWIKLVDIPEKYIFMSEPDHIFLHPLPNFMRGEIPAAYPFFYVVATDPKSAPHVKKHTGITTIQQLEHVFPVGNSPVFLSLEDMKKVMPVWHNITVNVFKDSAAAREWGWVQEMYGFAMAAWLVGLREMDLLPHLMSQPPYDISYEERKGRPFYIIHYTYGLDYNKTGVMLPDKIGEWHFDKRALRTPIPRNMKEPFPLVKNDLVRFLIRAFNEATDAFPCWDKYSETGDKAKTCDEAPKYYLATPEAALDWQIGQPVQAGSAGSAPA